MMDQATKAEACRQFAVRKDHAVLLQKIDAEGKHRDSCRCIYCRYCSTPVEIIVCDPVFPTRNECSQCKSLEENGWIEEAIRLHEGL